MEGGGVLVVDMEVAPTHVYLSIYSLFYLAIPLLVQRSTDAVLKSLGVAEGLGLPCLADLPTDCHHHACSWHAGCYTTLCLPYFFSLVFF